MQKVYIGVDKNISFATGTVLGGGKIVRLVWIWDFENSWGDYLNHDLLYF